MPIIPQELHYFVCNNSSTPPSRLPYEPSSKGSISRGFKGVFSGSFVHSIFSGIYLEQDFDQPLKIQEIKIVSRHAVTKQDPAQNEPYP